MRLSSLSNLLAGKLSAAEFSSELAVELSTHARALQVRGRSAPVVVVEDTDLLLDRRGLSVLCNLFASGQLTAPELAYLADALQMCERAEFADASIADDLAECTDPEINGCLTVSRALQIAAHEI